MSNHTLHEIYSPYSRTFSFEYLSIMRDKRNEIVEKIINDLKKDLKSKEKELKGYKKKSDILYKKSQELGDKLIEVNKLLIEASKDKRWNDALKYSEKQSKIAKEEYKITQEWLSIDVQKEWESDHKIKTKLQEEIIAIDFLIDQFKRFCRNDGVNNV